MRVLLFFCFFFYSWRKLLPSMTFRLRLTPPIFFYCSFPCANHGRTHRARKLFFVVVVFVVVTTVILVILAHFQSDLNTLVYIHNKHSAASQPARYADGIAQASLRIIIPIHPLSYIVRIYIITNGSISSQVVYFYHCMLLLSS